MKLLLQCKQVATDIHDILGYFNNISQHKGNLPNYTPFAIFQIFLWVVRFLKGKISHLKISQPTIRRSQDSQLISHWKIPKGFLQHFYII